MLRQRNNHGTAPCPSEDDRAVEQAFLRLGNVLAEIARDIVQRKAQNHIRRNRNEEGKD